MFFVIPRNPNIDDDGAMIGFLCPCVVVYYVAVSRLKEWGVEA
jgi:hypothetical protein